MHLGRPSLILLLTLVALAGAPVANAAATALDIRGDWNAPAQANGQTYPQIWHIATENLSTGAFTGYIKGNPGYHVDGQVVGTTWNVVATEGSYTSHAKATIVVSGGQWKAVNGTFSDSNGTVGTWSATRLSGPPSTQTVFCLGGCTTGTTFAYPASPAGLPPSPWDIAAGDPFPLSAGCSGPAGARDASIADTGTCTVDASVQTSLDPFEQILQQEYQNALDILRQIGSDPAPVGPDAQAIAGILPEMLQLQQNDYQNAQSIMQQMQQVDTAPTNGTDPFDAIDQTLAADFGSPAPAGARDAAAAQLPDAHLILQAVLAKHPSRKAISAFATALGLATSSTTSAGLQGRARLTLLVAVAAARGELRNDLRGRHTIVLCAGHGTVARRHHRRLHLAETVAGGRILRVDAVVGLTHPVRLRLKLRSVRPGRTRSAVRTISVR